MSNNFETALKWNDVVVDNIIKNEWSSIFVINSVKSSIASENKKITVSFDDKNNKILFDNKSHDPNTLRKNDKFEVF